jgi:hypothetical protein
MLASLICNSLRGFAEALRSRTITVSVSHGAKEILVGRHEDPDSPKAKPLDPDKGGQGSNDDENKTSSGKHGNDEGAK